MIKNIPQTNYLLKSLSTGNIFEDSGWILEAPGEDKPTLIRAIYEKQQLELKDDSYGIYKFADWLPVKKMLNDSASPITYKSKGLAKKLGLSNLYITFSGYWPEKGAMMKSCSFKETEAYVVCARMENMNKKTLVVASAGNTSRSFAKVCSDNNIPLLLCVPEDYINTLWFDEPLNDCVKLIVTRTGSDYFDAIHLSNIVSQFEGFIPEGGAKNIGRRDGMGTTVLSAATTIGRIPDYYFQAVGSGTGAISAWEANLRLIEDGRYGDHKMKLMVSQNTPFIPLYDAWKAGSREIFPMDDKHARAQVEQVVAKVLTNRKPNYPICGGLFDALTDTDGDVLIASNEDAHKAAAIFEETEGIDIHPAAAIATATLISAANEKDLDKDAVIMLNITGGGEERFMNDNVLFFLKPSLVFDIDPDPVEVRSKLKRLF
ncbi:MAG: cysteate synthase [Bacteroidales bacterium]|nr:cysteate synthase [Bacteroidales bacterium]